MKPVGDLKTQSGAYAIGLDDPNGIIVTIPPGYKLLVRTEDKHARLDITPMGPMPGDKYVRSFRVEPVKTDVPRAERAVNLGGIGHTEPKPKKFVSMFWWFLFGAVVVAVAMAAWSRNGLATAAWGGALLVHLGAYRKVTR